MRYKLTLQKVDEGHQVQDGPLRNVTTEAQVNIAIQGSPAMIIDVATLTEVQLRGVVQYFRAIATGLTTSSIETAVSAVI